MKFSQPLVLLLGSVLSASGAGCSAITAVVTDSRPESRENQSDADRLAAIGRVFENQGRYDKAEVMYRRALRERPQNSEIRSHLQLLAERRSEKKFGPTETRKALAMADRVSPPKSRIPQVSATVPATKSTLPPANPGKTAAAPARGPQQPSQVAESRHDASPAALIASPDSAATPTIELTSGNNQSWRSSGQHVINTDDILIALEQPDEHIDMLLEALESGDSIETRALAATLLGDCDPANTRVRDVLIQLHSTQSDPDVLIALCDSQIERGEADRQTLDCLLGMCTGPGSETQVQAASQLRNFVGTEDESSCLTALDELLNSNESSVRATAALALGDFTSIDSSTINRLRQMADADVSPNVREAAQSALTRRQSDSIQVIPKVNLKSEP